MSRYYHSCCTEETEVWKLKITCPRSGSYWGWEPGFQPKKNGCRVWLSTTNYLPFSFCLSRTPGTHVPKTELIISNHKPALTPGFTSAKERHMTSHFAQARTCSMELWIQVALSLIQTQHPSLWFLVQVVSLSLGHCNSFLTNLSASNPFNQLLHLNPFSI